MTKCTSVCLAAGLLLSSTALAEPPSITGLTPPSGAGTIPGIRHTARTTQDGKTVVYVAGPMIVSWNVAAGTRVLTLPAFTPTGSTTWSPFNTPLEVGALTGDGSTLFINQFWWDWWSDDYNTYTAPWRFTLDGTGGAVGAAAKVVLPGGTEAQFFGGCRVGAALSAGVFAGEQGSQSSDLDGTHPFAPVVVSNGQWQALGTANGEQDWYYNKVQPKALAQTARGLEVFAVEDVGWNCGASAAHYLAVVAGPAMPIRMPLQASYAAPNPAGDYVYEQIDDATSDGQLLAGWCVRYTSSSTIVSARLWPRSADGTALTPVVLDTIQSQNVRIDDAGKVVVYQRFLPGTTEDIMVRFLSSTSSVRLQDLLAAQGAAGASGWAFTTVQDLSGDGRVIVGTGKYQGGPAQVFRAVIAPPCNKADLGAQGALAMPDGLKDNNDFIVFIDLFFSNNPAADMGVQGGISGSDGLLDNNDFVSFINTFFGPCD